ncbi:MAG: dodecin family protein [Thermoanaerobaculia bacterium]
MSVAKIIEISAESPEGFDAAIREGIQKASESLKNIQGCWVKDQEVKVRDGKITSYQVTLKITFILQ